MTKLYKSFLAIIFIAAQVKWNISHEIFSITKPENLWLFFFLSFSQASCSPFHFGFWPKTSLFFSPWNSGPSQYEVRSHPNYLNGFGSFYRNEIRLPPLQPDITNQVYGPPPQPQQHPAPAYGVPQHQQQHPAPIYGVPQHQQQQQNPAPVYGPPQQQQSVGGSQQSFGESQHSFGESQHSFGGSQQQQSFGGSQQSFGGSQQSFGGSQPSFGGSQQSFGGSQPPFVGPQFGAPHQPDFGAPSYGPPPQQPSNLFGLPQQHPPPAFGPEQHPPTLYGQPQLPFFGSTNLFQPSFGSIPQQSVPELPTAPFQGVLPLIPRPGPPVFIPRPDLQLPSPTYLPAVPNSPQRPVSHLAVIHDSTTSTDDSVPNGNQQVANVLAENVTESSQTSEEIKEKPKEMKVKPKEMKESSKLKTSMC